MPKNYKLQILWSTRMTPDDIKKAVNDDERINALILKGVFRCRIGPLVKKLMSGVPTVRDVVVAPSEPHGIISDIYKEEDCWFGDVEIPSINGWTDIVNAMKDPVLHPLATTDGKICRIVHFEIIEKSMLNPNRVYDGIHYKEDECKNEEDIPDEIQDIIMKFKDRISQPSEKLFRIEISDDQNHYEHFGISIIVKAGNINHAYMKFWKDIINDKHIDFSDAEADPLFENDNFSNWVIDSSDDKHTTYKRLDKHFKIRVEELDMSKGYALVGDWST